MSQPNEEIALPTPSRAGWTFVLLIGIALAVLAGFEVADGLPRSGQRPIDVLGLGAGIFLALFSVAVQASRQLPAMLRIGPRTLTVACRNGESAVVPLALVASVETIGGASGGNTDVLALKKKDGGFIELSALRSSDAAEELAEPIRQALARAAGGEGNDQEDRSDSDDDPASTAGAAERLRSVRSVHVATDGDSLQLSWRARSAAKSLAALGPLAGMAILIYGFHLHDGGVGTIVAIAITVALGVALVAATLVNVGVSHRVTIDDRRLTAERLRRAKVFKRERLALRSIVTVDYAQALHVMGAGLTIRTASDAAAVDDDRDDAVDGVGSAKGEEADDAMLTGTVMKLLSKGIHISCFDLSLPARVALDLAVSDEVARRRRAS